MTRTSMRLCGSPVCISCREQRVPCRDSAPFVLKVMSNDEATVDQVDAAAIVAAGVEGVTRVLASPAARDALEFDAVLNGATVEECETIEERLTAAVESAVPGFRVWGTALDDYRPDAGAPAEVA